MATKKVDVKFEEDLKSLEEIVQKLENGDVALEEAISEFQKGIQISEKLRTTLQEAEKVLVKAVGKDEAEEVFLSE
ncbi:MAG: exodeoxyribonuclease VII small subunit [Lactovum sp.]